jgi:uncharacterized protein (TIGR02646 family)
MALGTTLREWSHGKCAYCESRTDVTGYLGIEHFAPKSSVHIDLAFEWTNLFPACHRCNVSKGEEDLGAMLIRPDIDDPEDLLWVNPITGELEPAAVVDPSTAERITTTVSTYDLDRGALTQCRKLLLTRVMRWLYRAGQGPLSPEMIEELEEFLHPETEYKLVIRQILKQGGLEDVVQEDRQRLGEVASEQRR